jgi:hypothetical protein
MPWKDHPRELALTAEHVCVLHRNGSVARLPLAALRAMRVSGTGDRLYLFGRSTRLLLPRRKHCDVVAALDRRLTGVG